MVLLYLITLQHTEKDTGRPILPTQLKDTSYDNSNHTYLPDDRAISRIEFLYTAFTAYAVNRGVAACHVEPFAIPFHALDEILPCPH